MQVYNIIKKQKNIRVLNPKILGILIAGGKYIMLFKCNDLFINEELLYSCFNEGIENNVNINLCI